MNFQSILQAGPIYDAQGAAVSANELFGAGKAVGLYFSASWCPPCRAFTPMLSEAYTKLKAEGTKLEVIFMSLDNEEGAYKEYSGKMPFLRAGFDDSRVKSVAGKLEVQSIPTLVMLDGDGKLMTTEAADNLRQGKPFPWATAPPNFKDILSNGPVLDSSKAPVDTSALFGPNKVLGIYFSASWCPPCRAFTPVLVKKYAEVKATGVSFEVILFSWDEENDQYAEYAAKMPWLRMPFDDKRVKALGQQLKVRGIPTLVMIDADSGRVLSTSAADKIRTGAAYPWA